MLADVNSELIKLTILFGDLIPGSGRLGARFINLIFKKSFFPSFFFSRSKRTSTRFYFRFNFLIMVLSLPLRILTDLYTR